MRKARGQPFSLAFVEGCTKDRIHKLNLFLILDFS